MQAVKGSNKPANKVLFNYLMLSYPKKSSHPVAITMKCTDPI